MEDRRTIPLTLKAGESRQLLLEYGSTVLVLEGRLLWREPPAWMADTVVACERGLGPEEVHRVERSGWTEFSASQAVQAVIIAPDSVAFWSQVGRCLGRLFDTGPARRPSP